MVRLERPQGLIVNNEDTERAKSWRCQDVFVISGKRRDSLRQDLVFVLTILTNHI